MASGVLQQLKSEVKYLALAVLLAVGGRYLGAQTLSTTARIAQQLPTFLPRAIPLAKSGQVRFDARRVKENIRYVVGKIGPRPAGSAAEKQMARYICESLAELGYQAKLSRPIPLPGRNTCTQNVTATCPQMHRGPAQLILCAHYDSKASDVPGANDNGSGVCTLLEVARVLAQHPLTYQLVLAFFGAEEHLGGPTSPSLIGSRAYAWEYQQQNLDNIGAVINVDMVGVGTNLYVGGVGPGADQLQERVAQAARKLCLELRIYTGKRGSDHFHFGRVGIPAVRLQRLPAPCRDTPADVPGNVETDALLEIGQLLVSLLTVEGIGKQ